MLSIDVELAKGFDLISEEFRPERHWGLPGIKIDNAATDGELPTDGDLGDALIAAAYKSFKEAFHLRGRSALKLGDGRFQRAVLRRSLIETRACCYDDVSNGSAPHLHKDCQPFGGDFRIRQNIFGRCKLCFREEKRIRLPVEQTFIEQLLRMNTGTKDPNRGIGSLPIIGQ